MNKTAYEHQQVVNALNRPTIKKFVPVSEGVSDELRTTLIQVVHVLLSTGVHANSRSQLADSVGIQHLLFGIQQYCIERGLCDEEGTLEPHETVEGNAWCRVARAVETAQKVAEANNL